MSTSRLRRNPLGPILAGVVAGLALVGLYLGILSIAQSPSHALDQLAQDRLWVGLVATGFGVQIGLYTYLRAIVQAAKLAGATAVTGVGTGASTMGMVACCAHHLTDIAPLLGLTAGTQLGGAVAFLTEWKIPFILLGLAVNAVGILVSLNKVRQARRHLRGMLSGALAETAPACH